MQKVEDYNFFYTVSVVLYIRGTSVVLQQLIIVFFYQLSKSQRQGVYKRRTIRNVAGYGNTDFRMFP